MLVQLEAVYLVFHVSLLKRCVADPASILTFEIIGVKDSLTYKDVLVEILDRQVQRLKKKEVTSVKVLWRIYSIERVTCEVVASMKVMYPHPFPSD